ncbi:MAG: hypothetical protein ABL959_00825 [Pyrinomonadaceae bacterium]
MLQLRLSTLFVFLVLFAVGFAAFESSRTASAAHPQPTPASQNKGMSDYRGVAIGMATDDVRKKLGNPKDKSDTMDLYTFSDAESAQFYYGPEKTVTAIMITFSGELKDAPLPKTVLGEEVEAKPDGSIFKMLRFPKAGYWISYNRTPAPDAIVNIALQKM